VQWGHYSKLGNDIVARFLLERLAEWGLDTPERVKEAAFADERIHRGLSASE